MLGLGDQFTPNEMPAVVMTAEFSARVAFCA
jgi:hypothetical protein